MAIRSAVGYSENIDEAYEAGLEIGDMVLEKIKLQAHSAGILFCHIDFDFGELLRGIREKLDIPIFGCTTAGEANNDGYFEESASLMVITSDDIKIGVGVGENLSQNLEAAVFEVYASARAMLGGDIEPLVIMRSGWIPMGKKAKITKAEGNVLYEIDHQPAIEYLKNYIPNIDDPDLMGTYPIALLDESPGAEAGKYFVIRGGFTYNKERNRAHHE
jgi:hypothetical protein